MDSEYERLREELEKNIALLDKAIEAAKQQREDLFSEFDAVVESKLRSNPEFGSQPV